MSQSHTRKVFVYDKNSVEEADREGKLEAQGEGKEERGEEVVRALSEGLRDLPVGV